ncbi:MAG: transposase [Planctomycetes bacterium]|nr:transposase [Planctomycetota bacterium]
MRPELREAVAPEKKVRILRRHFLDKAPVSDLCDELVLNPNVFYSWQETLFEAGSDAPRLLPPAILSHQPRCEKNARF